MAIEDLFLIEGRLRAFTEHFRATEWVVLYHNQVIAESYWCPPLPGITKNSKVSRIKTKTLFHDQYPNFFKAIISIKKIFSTTVIGSADGKPVLEQLFSNIGEEDTVGAIEVVKAKGVKGKKPFATILYKNKSAKSTPISSSTSIRETCQAEKKVLHKIAHLLSDYLKQQQDHLREQIQYQWNSSVAPIIDSNFYKNNTTSQSHLKHFIHGIKTALNADDFQLYWASDELYPLKSASSTNLNGVLKPEEFDARRLILKNNFNVQQKVKVWNGKNFSVHSKIKAQLKLILDQPYPTLWLMFSFNEKQKEHILGHNLDKIKKSNGSYLVVELVREKSKPWFNNFDIEFAAHSQKQLEKEFLKPALLNDLRDVVKQQLKPVIKLGEAGNAEEVLGATPLATPVVDEPSLYHIQSEGYLDYELAYAQRQFSTNRFVTLDKKSDYGYFYFGDLSTLNDAESYFVSTGFDYLQDQTLDILDLAKQFTHLTNQVKKPISYGIIDFPNPTHLTKVKKSDNPISQLGLLGNGVNFYRYSFETGKLKALINFPQRMVIELNSQDLVIALPKPLSVDQRSNVISEGMLRELEKELIIWGHSDSNELAKVVGNSMGGSIPHFVLVRKTI